MKRYLKNRHKKPPLKELTPRDGQCPYCAGPAETIKNNGRIWVHCWKHGKFNLGQIRLEFPFCRPETIYGTWGKPLRLTDKDAY